MSHDRKSVFLFSYSTTRMRISVTTRLASPRLRINAIFFRHRSDNPSRLLRAPNHSNAGVRSTRPQPLVRPDGIRGAYLRVLRELRPRDPRPVLRTSISV